MDIGKCNLFGCLHSSNTNEGTGHDDRVGRDNLTNGYGRANSDGP